MKRAGDSRKQLVDVSPLDTGTAEQHLLATETTLPGPPSGGGPKSAPGSLKRKKEKEEALELYQDDKDFIELVKILSEWV
jgi:hypothetical protein